MADRGPEVDVSDPVSETTPGRRVRAARLREGFATLVDLQLSTKISYTTLHDIEHDKVKWDRVHVGTLLKLSNAVKLSIDQIMLGKAALGSPVAADVRMLRLLEVAARAAQSPTPEKLLAVAEAAQQLSADKPAADS